MRRRVRRLAIRRGCSIWGDFSKTDVRTSWSAVGVLCHVSFQYSTILAERAFLKSWSVPEAFCTISEEAASLAAISAFSLPGMPWWAGTQARWTGLFAVDWV